MFDSAESACTHGLGACFAHYLYELRTARGLSQQDLADLAGVSRNQISNLERAGSGSGFGADPKLSTIVSLAQALDVEPMSLLVGAAGLEPFGRYDIARRLDVGSSG